MLKKIDVVELHASLSCTSEIVVVIYRHLPLGTLTKIQLCIMVWGGGGSVHQH